MSLSDAILEIVAEMEECLTEVGDKVPVEHSSVKSWVKQLRRVVKASASAGPPIIPAGGASEEPQAPKVLQALKNPTPHRLLLFEHARKMLEGQEEAVLLGNMAMMVGGSCNGDSHPVGVEATVGQLFERDGEVYVLKEDGKLHFSAVETIKHKGLKPTDG